MSDLVERLRDRAYENYDNGEGSVDSLSDEAADEIERLRERVAEVEARAVALYWRLPDETVAADLRKDAAIAFEALRQHSIDAALAGAAVQPNGATEEKP